MRLFKRSLALAAWLALGVCLAQPEVRITRLDASGTMDYTLTPEDGVSQYACTLEWTSDLRTSWTNGWYKPFETVYTQSNGIYSAPIPRFFRIRCRTNGSEPVSNDTRYVVTAVTPSATSNGVISWASVGGDAPVYHVEFSTNAIGGWSGHWAYRTNLTATSLTTNSFRLPIFYRVVTIRPHEGSEDPWLRLSTVSAWFSPRVRRRYLCRVE